MARGTAVRQEVSERYRLVKSLPKIARGCSFLLGKRQSCSWLPSKASEQERAAEEAAGWRLRALTCSEGPATVACVSVCVWGFSEQSAARCEGQSSAAGCWGTLAPGGEIHSLDIMACSDSDAGTSFCLSFLVIISLSRSAKLPVFSPPRL